MILREGTKGDLVKKLQEGLAYLGYHPGPIDGHYGQMTEDAVEAFQKKSKTGFRCKSLTTVWTTTRISPLIGFNACNYYVNT